MAGPLSANVVADVTRRVLVWDLCSGRIGGTLARAEAHLARAGVNGLVGDGVVDQLARGEPERLRGLRANASPCSTTCWEQSEA